jgi:hypothetical protein
MRASQRELLCFKVIMETYAQSTGLRVNYAKSCMIPLNLESDKLEAMAGVFGCKLQQMPFAYLGLPMGTTKPRVEHYAPLMNRVERQLTSISSLLTYASKLQLVNSVLSSLSTFTMCSVSVPVAVLECFDRAGRHCMWRKSEANAKSKPLVAWKKCTKPKRKRGLGIINLRSQNVALLLKHLDKFYNKKDISWVHLIWNTYYSNGEVPQASKDRGSFWWRDLLKLCDIFRGIATCKVGDDSTVLFWSDVWNDHLLQNKYPRLYSFAKNKQITVAQFLLNNQIESQFYLPLSVQDFQEYQDLQQLIQQLQIEPENKDSWHNIWGNSNFTASRFYHLPFKNLHPPHHFIWI